MSAPEPNSAIMSTLAAFPDDVRRDCLGLRAAVFAVAHRDPRIGALKESLKWGEPAWRPKRPRTGTTLRLGWRSDAPDDLLLFVHCRTDLVERFRAICGPNVRFEGRRAMVLPRCEPRPPAETEMCIAAALTYHLGPTST